MRSSTIDGEGLELGARRVAAPRVPDLVQEELLEDHSPLRRRAEGVEQIDVCLAGRKVRLLQREAPRQQVESSSAGRPGSSVGHLRRHLVERLPHDSPLHVRRHGAGLLVERHDAACVNHRLLLRHELVLGIHEVQPARIELHVAEHDDGRCGFRMSARNGWFIQVHRIAPLASSMTA